MGPSRLTWVLLGAAVTCVVAQQAPPVSERRRGRRAERGVRVRNGARGGGVCAGALQAGRPGRGNLIPAVASFPGAVVARAFPAEVSE